MGPPLFSARIADMGEGGRGGGRGGGGGTGGTSVEGRGGG